MKKTFTIIISILSLYACQSTSQKTADSTTEKNKAPVYERLSVAQFQNKLATLPSYQLVDVRTPEEYDAGKIGEAINLNFYDDNFKTEIAKLKKEEPVLVYCKAGGRSKKAADIMVELGFKEIYELEKGYSSWEQ